MNELIDWVENSALENIRFHLQDADNLARESNITLTVLLTGVGGSLAFAFDSNGTVTVSTLILAGYLSLLSALLIFNCMKITPVPAPTNEPRNLYQKQFTLIQLKEVELDNLQKRIDEAVKRNDAITGWLNRIRIFATLSPFVWAAAYYLLPHLFGLAAVAG